MQPQHLHLHCGPLGTLRQAVTRFLGHDAPGFENYVALFGGVAGPPPPRSVRAWLAVPLLTAVLRRLVRLETRPPRFQDKRRCTVRPRKVRVSLPELLALYHCLPWPADPAHCLQPARDEVHRCLTNLSQHLDEGGELVGYELVGYELVGG